MKLMFSDQFLAFFPHLRKQCFSTPLALSIALFLPIGPAFFLGRTFTCGALVVLVTSILASSLKLVAVVGYNPGCDRSGWRALSCSASWSLLRRRIARRARGPPDTTRTVEPEHLCQNHLLYIDVPAQTF